MTSRRRHVRLDAWALLHVHDEFGIGPTESLVLLTLVMHADYRSRLWEGTRWELARMACGLSRNTVHKACDRLVTLGLVEERKPFGPNSKGVLYLACYDEFVAPNAPNAPNARGDRSDLRDPLDDVGTARAPTGQRPRTKRAEIAQISAVDQGERASVRSMEEGSKEVAESVTPENGDDAQPTVESGSPAEEFDPDAPFPWVTPSRKVAT